MLREAPWASNACNTPSDEAVCGAYGGGGEASSLVPAPGPSVVVALVSHGTECTADGPNAADADDEVEAHAQVVLDTAREPDALPSPLDLPRRVSQRPSPRIP